MLRTVAGVVLSKITEGGVVDATVVIETEEVDINDIVSRVGAILVEEIKVSSEAVVVDNIVGVIEGLGDCRVVEDIEGITTGVVTVIETKLEAGIEVGTVMVGVSDVKMIVRESSNSVVTVSVGEADTDVIIV